MVFQKFDAGEVAGRSPDSKGVDCQVRALCTALDLPYQMAWDLLYKMQGARRACSFLLTADLRDNHPDLRVVRQIDFPAVKGRSRMTAASFASAYRTGRFILRMANHVATVKDGKLLDTWDSSKKCVYTAWEIRPPSLLG